MPTILEQYRISDFLEWYKRKQLQLNPEFQRGSVWISAARTYLIDSILRELPIPKIYLRTLIDIETKQSIREVVDGQQRLRAIIDFAEDKFALTKRAAEFSGQRYSDLPSEYKEIFLSYPISVGQLLNANDDDVLEIFSRLNSYNVTLNAAELRHAKYQGDFKWFVRNTSKKWAVLWDEYEIVSVRDRVRMLDDSLTAEMLGVLMEGVNDGGQPKINALYQRYDRGKEDKIAESLENFDNIIRYFIDNLADGLRGTPLLRSAHFFMVFSALSHAITGIPQGGADDYYPLRRSQEIDAEIALAALIELAAIIESEVPPTGFNDFWNASKTSTQRISSRRVRLSVYYSALFGEI